MRQQFFALILFLGMTVLGARAVSAQDACIAAPPAQIEVGMQVIVQRNQGTPLTVRDEGSTYGSVIGELPPRSIVTVVGGPQCGRANGLYTWWQVASEEGLVGWVAEGDSFRSTAQYFIAPLDRSDIQPEGEACGAAPPSQVEIGDFAVVSQRIGTDLVLRETPSGRILDYLLMGTRVQIVDGPRCGTNNRLFKWWQVQTEDGLLGWVAEGDATQTPPLYFIEPDSSTTGSARRPIDPGCDASFPSILQVGDTVEVTDEGGFPLILRSTPAGSRFGEFRGGTLLEILGGPRCGNAFAFWEVQAADGRRGWVAEGDATQSPIVYFIRLVEASPEVPLAEVTPTGVFVELQTSDCEAAPPMRLVVGDPAVTATGSVGNVPLRTGPSAVANQLSVLAPETYMIVLNGPRCGDGNNLYAWWQVRVEDGSIGWVQEGDAAQSPPIYYVSPVTVSP
jgi:hypothetical protein